MYSPDAGRPNRWQDGKMVAFDRSNPNTISTGARWADPETEFWVHNICAGSTSLMNCNNDNEIYSFHIGGCYVSFADGSVQFLNNTLDTEVQSLPYHPRWGRFDQQFLTSASFPGPSQFIQLHH